MTVGTTTTAAMTTDPRSVGARRVRWRFPVLGFATALLVMASVACTSQTPSAGTTTVAAAATVPTSSAGSTAPADPAPAIPADLLSQALDRYARGYEFTATVTVNGQQASTVEGRWVAGASQVTVSSGDGQVEYLIVGANEWVRLPGGDWEALDGVPAESSPLLALAAPASFGPLETVGEAGHVVNATYAAAVLGLSGEPVVVRLAFADRFLVEASYRAAVDDGEVTTVTSFKPILDVAPITAPPA